tara:strand:+ start:3190 stop:3447 length:258 start_codon:yes stop_codon:yes gene_type:complete
MKIFVVKTFIIALTFYTVFELTIGTKIRDIKESITKYQKKTERVKLKEKIFSELEDANQKDKILSEKDREILSKFLKKIKNELDL